MIFSTFDEYDMKLEEIEIIMEDMKKHMDEYPDNPWIERIYICLKEIYKLILKDRAEFLEMLHEKIVLRLCGEEVKNHKISISIMAGLFNNFNDLINFLSNFVKNDLWCNFESHDLKL